MVTRDQFAVIVALIGAVLALGGLGAIGRYLADGPATRHRAAMWATGGALVVVAAQLLALLSLSSTRATLLGGLVLIVLPTVGALAACVWALRERHLRHEAETALAEAEVLLAVAAGDDEDEDEPAVAPDPVESHWATLPAWARRARRRRRRIRLSRPEVDRRFDEITRQLAPGRGDR